MNKKILASLLVIGVVAAVAGGSTFALFNDTETSSGNTFAAGELDLQVDWEETYNGELVEEQELTDNPGPIFNLNDVKPGDEGEATVSLHVFDNPAFVDMNFTRTDNFENGCSEPEAEVDDTCGSPGAGEGELGENLYFTVWNDDGDNVRQEDETVYFNGTADELDEVRTVWLDGDAETEGIQPFENSTTEYVGIKWHVPRDVGNEIQTDSEQFNFTFWAEQARHNEMGKNMTMPEEPEEEEDNVTPNYWQVDLAEGHVIEDLGDQTYSDRGDLERFQHGVSNETGFFKIDEQGYPDQSECIITEDEEFEIVGDEAQIDFTIKDETECATDTKVTLASYGSDQPGWNGGEGQTLFANETDNLEPGDYSWTVELPEPQEAAP